MVAGQPPEREPLVCSWRLEGTLAVTHTFSTSTYALRVDAPLTLERADYVTIVIRQMLSVCVTLIALVCGWLLRARATPSAAGGMARALLLGPVVAAIAVLLLYHTLIRTPVLDGRILVVSSSVEIVRLGINRQGFMSEFMNALSAIAYASRHGAASVEIRYSNPWYTDPVRGDNYWAYFMEPDIALRAANRWWPALRWYTSFSLPMVLGRSFNALGMDKHRRHARPWPLPDEQCGAACSEWDAELHAAAQRVRVQSWLRAEVDSFVEKCTGRADGAFIGVSFRGTNKRRSHYPYAARWPTVAMFAAEIDRVSSAMPTSHPLQIFVATEEAEFVDALSELYRERVCALPLKRVPETATEEEAATLAQDRWDNGRDVLFDTLVLSRAIHLVRNRASVADVATLIAPSHAFRWTYLLATDEVYRARGVRSARSGEKLT